MWVRRDFSADWASRRSLRRVQGVVKIVRDGITRTVLLAGVFAFKVPTPRYGWAKFLRGLLANLQERAFARAAWDGLCPIVWSAPGGWLVVMRRARPLTNEEWRTLDVDRFIRRPEYMLPVEAKHDSFGVVDGIIVAVDYGN